MRRLTKLSPHTPTFICCRRPLQCFGKHLAWEHRHTKRNREFCARWQARPFFLHNLIRLCSMSVFFCNRMPRRISVGALWMIHSSRHTFSTHFPQFEVHTSISIFTLLVRFVSFFKATLVLLRPVILKSSLERTRTHPPLLSSHLGLTFFSGLHCSGLGGC